MAKRSLRKPAWRRVQLRRRRAAVSSSGSSRPLRCELHPNRRRRRAPARNRKDKILRENVFGSLENYSSEDYNQPEWKRRLSYTCIYIRITAFWMALAKLVSWLAKRHGGICPPWPSPTTGTYLPPSIFITKPPRG